MTPKLGFEDLRAPSTARPPAPAVEHRRWPRHRLSMRCWLTGRGHTRYLRLHDLSLGGLSVRAPMPFRRAGKLEVVIELGAGRVLKARGEVVWVRERLPGLRQPSMGARFLEFLEGETELEALLDAATRI
jgi:hypothetical protein